ncbi:MAG: FMN-binding protein [Cellulophaga sp.]|uniref:FMN-binding protein n=1 Tax=Cellulophaga sp. TaxID=1972202 RepID=UPI003263ADB6
MHLENKRTLLFITAFTFLLLAFNSPQLPEKLQKKVNAAISYAYGTESFKLSGITSDVIPPKDYVFKIKTDDTVTGYAYVGQANSMKNVFDYVVFINKDLSIKKTKVLIYREDHGRQIGAQRWLKQFIGLSINKKPVYGENVDAISGATISAKSMTIAVKDVLETIQKLNNKKLL